MRKIAYSSEIFKVEEYNDRKRPDKKFYRILSPDSVAILPIRAGKVLLERQYRYSIGRYLYEAPAGYINKGEKPSTAAGDTADVEITGNTYACYIGMEIKDPMLIS